MAAELPAILGGEKAFPLGPPLLTQPDEVFQNLADSFKDSSWASYDAGHITSLEKSLCDVFNSTGALTCASGTLAVEVGLKALGIKQGDLVGLAAYEYPGNFLTLHAINAKPFLIDLDPSNFQISPLGIKLAIQAGCKALIVSHLHGGIADMKSIMALCRDAGVGVVEDACQCPGAVFDGKSLGTWGDIGVLSFGGSKLLTSGRGGALLSNNPSLFQKAKLLLLRGSKLAPLSEIQAIVLKPQLANLKKLNAIRAKSVFSLQQMFFAINGIKLIQLYSESDEPAFYKLGMILDSEKFGLDRHCLIPAIQAEGIALDAGFAALQVSRSPSRWQSSGPLPIAALAHEGMLVLHHPVLLEGDGAIKKIIEALKKIQKHRVEVRKKVYS